jgi:hypothetical protein
MQWQALRDRPLALTLKGTLPGIEDEKARGLYLRECQSLLCEESLLFLLAVKV